MTMKHSNADLSVILTNLRTYGIEKGFLIDISETAKKAGFRYPVDVTLTVWIECIESPQTMEGCEQDIQSRLWYMLSTLKLKTQNVEESFVDFQLYFLMQPEDTKVVNLTAMCGSGDDGTPVITIMFTDEFDAFV